MSSGISTKPDQAGHGAPFLSFSTVFNNYFVPEFLPDLMDISQKEKETYSIQEGDIFLTRTSETLNELGMSCVAIKNFPESSFSGFLKRLRPKHDNITYAKFMAFYLRSNLFRKTMTNNAIMTLRASLNEQIFSYLDLILPEYEQQKKIGEVLFRLNQKIELNNRINVELEQMAKTIYDYWFVQFDFPISAEYAASVGQSELEGKPYKSSGGKMVWIDELKREVPEGWEPGTFNSYCPSTGGFAFKSEWWTDKGVAVAKIKDIQEDYRLETSDLARVDISDKNIDEKFKSKPGDILIAMTGATVGKYAIVPITDYPIYVNQRVGYFNLGNNPCKRLPFLINSMNQSYFRNAIFTLANGAAQPNISNDQINNIPLLIPKAELISEFNRMFESYYKKLLINQSENQKLTELRDWLLPMLMNGQVKVGDLVDDGVMGMAADEAGQYKSRWTWD